MQVTDPETKRKVIGHTFIEVFEQEAKQVGDAEFLLQGTLYPDVIESISFKGTPPARFFSLETRTKHTAHALLSRCAALAPLAHAQARLQRSRPTMCVPLRLFLPVLADTDVLPGSCRFGTYRTSVGCCPT